MNRFKPNITRGGRVVRAIMTAALFVAGIIVVRHMAWLGVVLFVATAVGIFEVLRGWCLLRACGIKTWF
jgi:hypothetical protein